MTEQKSRMLRKRNIDAPIEEKKETETETSDEKSTKRSKKRKRKPRIRLIPIWLRILIAIVLIGGSFLLGLIVGYGVIGDGMPDRALKPETWYHIIDIIQGR